MHPIRNAKRVTAFIAANRSIYQDSFDSLDGEVRELTTTYLENIFNLELALTYDQQNAAVYVAVPIQEN